MTAPLALVALISCSPRSGGPREEATTTTTAARPPVILVSWDTVSAQHLALWGEGARTPNLDALAARGARYAQAITHFPETSWSHWSMLTGVEPALHGDIPAAHTSAWTGPTVAERLREQGYTTAAFIGGITLVASLSGLNRGFDLYDDRGDPSREPMRAGPAVTEAALTWMRAQEGPYFAFVHTFDAHYPYEPAPGCDPGYTGSVDGSIATLSAYQGEAPPRPVLPPEDLRHVVALYRCEIEALDRELGRLLDAAPPEARIVVVADHGESFGGGYYFNHRASLRDEVLRVPLVVAPPPEGLAPGAVVQEQIGLSAVYALLLGEAPALSPVVATATDPWEGPGLLSLRAGPDKAIWRLAAGGMGRPVGAPIAVLQDDAPREEAGLPSSLDGAVGAYEARIRALEPQMRALPPASDAAPPAGALEALGYKVRGADPGGPTPREGH